MATASFSPLNHALTAEDAAALLDAAADGRPGAETRLLQSWQNLPPDQLLSLFSPLLRARREDAATTLASAEAARRSALSRLHLEQDQHARSLELDATAAEEALQNALRQLPVVQSPGWQPELWKTYSAKAQFADERFPDSLCAGTIAAPDTPPLPALLPFFCAAPVVVIRSGEAGRASALEKLETLVWRAAATLPAQLQFLFLDPHNRNAGTTFRWAKDLPGRKPDSGGDLARDLQAVENHIQRLATDHLSVDFTDFAALPPARRRREKALLLAIADFPRGFQRDPHSLDALLRILRNGGPAGVFVILHLNTDVELPRDFPAADNPANGFPPSTLILDHDTLSFAGASSARWDSPPPPELRRLLAEHLLAFRPDAPKTHFVALPEQEWWRESAAQRITAPIGLAADGLSPLNVLFGVTEADSRPCVHGVIGAGTGAGKSNLLHALILGLAQRYSPDELEFCLVDGKDGVEFAVYENLPHVRVLSLRTSPALSRSVLADLKDEMQRRNAEFLRRDVKDYESYAALRQERAFPPLPRILLVVDEYQELFVDDAEGLASRDLRDLAEKGRSTGIHFLLASQRFGAAGMQQRDAIFGSIQLRIAMRIPPEQILSLSEFEREGKEAIRALDLSGKVVINDLEGKDGGNRSGQVALLQSEKQSPGYKRNLCAGLLARWEKTFPERTRRPIVLHGLAQPRLRDNPFLAKLAALPPTDDRGFAELALSALGIGAPALPEWLAHPRPLLAWVGREQNIRGFAALALRRERDQNILLLGDTEQQEARHGVLLTLLSSLALNPEPPAIHLVECASATRRAPLGPWRDLCSARLPRFHVSLESDPASAAALIESLHASLALPDPTPAIVVLSAPEKLAALLPIKGAYGSDPSPLGAKLEALLQQGPARGLHFILVTESLRALDDLGPRGALLQRFALRIVFQVSEDDSFDLTRQRAAQLLQKHGAQPVLALLHSTQAARSTVFAPHLPGALAPSAQEAPGILADLPTLLPSAP